MSASVERTMVPPRIVLVGLTVAYPLLMIGSAWLKPAIAIPSALFPPLALTFTAYHLLHRRYWPMIFAITLLCDYAVITGMTYGTSGALPSPGYVLTVSLSTALIALGMVSAVIGFRVEERGKQEDPLTGPLFVLALTVGTVPGDLLSAWVHEYAAHSAWSGKDVAIRLLSSVLTVVALSPLIIGLFRGFSPPQRPAGLREKALIGGAFVALWSFYCYGPWFLDRFLELMLLAGPLLWLALRCSQRAVAVMCAALAIGVSFASTHGFGNFPPLVLLGNWRDGILSTQVFLLIICGEAVLINRMVLRQRTLLEDSRRKQQMLAAYGKALDETEDLVRRSAARDLHDGVAQIIAGQGMILGAMRRRIPDRTLCEMLDQALAASREAQSAIREAIEDLSPPEMERASLHEMLTWIGEFFSLRYQFQVEWRISGDEASAAGHQRLIYRALRELLFNAYRHSGAEHAQVFLDLGSQVRVTVRDDGVGFELQKPAEDSRRRLGLLSLSERVGIAGGHIDIRTAAGHGCEVCITLPAAVDATDTGAGIGESTPRRVANG